MTFDFHFSALTICLFAGALLALLYVCLVYCTRIYAVGKLQRSQTQAETQSTDGIEYPRVSVIVYTQDEPDALTQHLPMIMEQEYPGKFEVIVVNEGMSADVGIAARLLKNKYPNIYLTFTPDESRNLSKRKLALTLAIKAAKGDVLVITDARAKVPGNQWLRLMVEPIVRGEGKEVVLGYGYQSLPEKAGAGVKTMAFDLAADAVTWISAAQHGHPYRGCAYNLAYKRHLFFDAKGFSQSINMKDGDDDAFLSAIATAENAALQLADEAIVSLDTKAYMRHGKDDRRRHAFTGRRLYHGSRRLISVGAWAMWLAFGLAIAAGACAGVSNLAGWMLTAVLVIAWLVTVAVSWRNTLRSLQVPYSLFLLPFVAAFRPIRNMLVNLASRRSGHYIWQ